MKKITSRLCFSIMAFAFTASAQAQAPAATGDGCIKVNFDRNVKALPAGFCGNEWSDVLKGVQSLPLVKDQFETSAQHSARIKKTLEKPLYGAVSGTGTLAFVARLKTTYNADKGQYEIYLPTFTIAYPSYTDQRYKHTLEIDGWNGASSSYAGQNAYGATREVTQTTKQSILLDSVKTRLIDSNHMTFRLPAAEAKKLDGHVLAYLYIGKIAPPYHVMERETTKPTIDNPVETSRRLAVIGFATEETWLFDVQTGQILSKKIKVTR